MRSATCDLHVAAESTGFLHELLKGRGSKSGYSIFLRNLLPTYEALETGSSAFECDPAFNVFATPALARAPAIRNDLSALSGHHWHGKLPLLDAARHYSARIREVAASEPDRLIGHAYVRYLGDLSGGQILWRVLRNSLSLPKHADRFFSYDGSSPADLKALCIQSLESCSIDGKRTAAIVDEAVVAFRHNINVSIATHEQQNGQLLRGVSPGDPGTASDPEPDPGR